MPESIRRYRLRKNEAIICVGVDDDYKVDWSYVISWTPNQAFRGEITNFFMDQKKLDLVQLADWLGPHIEQNWKRREFKEYEYISVEPPLWGTITTYVLTMITCLGVAAFAILNGAKPPE